MVELLQKINNLKNISFNSEDDLIIKHVLPFFEIFGYSSQMFTTKFPINGYRTNKKGRKPEADCVFFSSKDHNFKTTLIVVETKRDENHSPIEQAKYYSDNLFTPFFITWEKLQFEIYQCKRFESPISLGRYEIGSISSENFYRLIEILSPKKIIEYCNKNEIKSIDCEEERKRIESVYLNNLLPFLRDSFFLDLSRPLNVVDGFVQLYLSEYKLPDTENEDIEEKIESGIHAKYIEYFL